jgi:hypothetical protein
MKHREVFQYVAIFFLTISCVVQSTKQNEESLHHSSTVEIKEREGPTLTQPGKKCRKYVPGEVIIRFEDETDERTIETIQKELGLETIKVISKPNLYLMKILDDTSVETMVERLRNHKKVKYAEPNYVRTVY